MFFIFFSLDSYSFSLCISISCSLSWPNNAVVVIVDKSIDSEMVVTLGCQLLSSHFSTLMFTSSLSNFFPKPIRWLTLCVNLFYAPVIDSPYCILNNSYSCIKACFLALFILFVPSWVTSSTSHMSFAFLHWKTLKNSFVFNEELRMFLLYNHIEHDFFPPLSIDSMACQPTCYQQHV